MPSIRRLVGVAVAVAVFTPAPAQAFDAGPHTDITRDAFTAEGFGLTAANVAVAENWLVDFYWNASKNPFSGHAPFKIQTAGNPPPEEVEYWDEDIIAGTNHMHFDKTAEGYPDLSKTSGIEDEWQRLIQITKGLMDRARADRNALTVVAALGMSLHTVQDFYAHSNWVESPGNFDGPGWSPQYGSTPTYFDVPQSVRTADGVSLYTNADGSPRKHGKWQTDKNASLEHGINKDWPGRPLYDKAYMTAYFASRQWIRAARGWLADDALWAKAQRLATPARLSSDLTASLDVSRYTGHWQGSGEPCEWVVVACGELMGYASSVLGARSAIKTYHEDHRISAPRDRFEDLAPSFTNKLSDDRVPDPVSSRDMQRRTRFVKVKIYRMRGFDWALGDPGPDDADLYAGARIRGQDFISTVIHDNDVFGFPKPYAPFTWIRSVPTDWRASEPVRALTVRVRTGDRRYAGTNDSVYLRVNNGLRFELEKRAYDDFERDDDDTYAVALDAVSRAGLSLRDIDFAQIEKSSDGAGGGWFLRSFEVKLNGKVIASPTVNRWLEDDRRTARVSIERDNRTRDVVPVWLMLREDDYLYGADDNGDINQFDRNKSVKIGYEPGPGSWNREATGDDELSGRLSMDNGEKGQIQFAITTLKVTVPKFDVPPVIDPLPTPTPTPTGTPTPTPLPTPTASPTPTPAPTPPDLVITAFSSFEITVKNQGGTATGPFNINAGGFPAIRSQSLAAGESRTFPSGHGCAEGTFNAVVDSSFEVAESNENNNTASVQQIC